MDDKFILSYFDVLEQILEPRLEILIVLKKITVYLARQTSKRITYVHVCTLYVIYQRQQTKFQNLLELTKFTGVYQPILSWLTYMLR